jgi:hypothetical protein
MRSANSSSVILAFGIFVLAACADSATGANRAASMTLSVTGRPAVATSALSSAAPITIEGGGNTLVIDQVRVVLGEIELRQAEECDDTRSGDSRSGSGVSGSECSEVELDPLLVDVPLNGTAILDLGALVPAGTYRELEFTIESADDDRGAEAAFLRAHPEFRGVSIRVDGTFNGQPFTFKSALEAEIEAEFNTPLVVTADNPISLTLSVDVASWFKAADGSVLDPSSAANALRIAQNIALSFAAFEDEDRNGVEDHRR